MPYESIRIFPLGDAALTVEFGQGISEVLNKKAIALAGHFEQTPFPGFREAIPAYSSATIFYDLVTVRKRFPEFPTAFGAVKSLAIAAINNPQMIVSEITRTVEIPVSFAKNSAPDMEFVTEYTGLSREQIIRVFTSTVYRVFMLGFLPGFAYLGEVDARLAVPRKETPRLQVPKGSVAITGRQTGIYSLESPGGWQIIGRTKTEMFTPKAETLCPLAPGDHVRFVEAQK